MNDGNFLLYVTKKFDLVKGQWQELYSDENTVFTSYEPINSSKKYLFLWGNKEPEEQIDLADELIDKYIEYTVIPQDTYLILFSKVQSLNEKNYKKIIKVEENEFCYKKYVCYYIESEIDALRKKNDDIFKYMSNFFSRFPDHNKSDEFSLLYRMIIKIPIIKMEFEKKELDDFFELYNTVRKETQSFSINEINEMENKIFSKISEDNKLDERINDLVEELIENIYGGDINEYLS